MSIIQDEWHDYGYVISSKYRYAAITHLGIGPATPTQLGEVTGLGVTHVSRGLQELRERGLVELLVPENTPKGRYYGLSGKGEDVAAMLAERDER